MSLPVKALDPQRIDMAFVRAAARGSLSLPSVPHVVRKLISQLRSPETSMHSLVAELEQEPQLAARTLRIANSAYYCGRRSVASLSDAVVVVGINTLRTLVISCGVQSVFVNLPGVNLRQFWLDAGITAKAARGLARLAHADAEAALLAGLLHGVGHLILCQAFPAEMGAKLVGATQRRGAELAALELEACGIAHPAVGAAWLDELGFPEQAADAVANQLTAEATSQGLAPLLALASQLVTSLEAFESADTAAKKLDPRLLHAASLRAETLGKTFSEIYRQLSVGESGP